MKRPELGLQADKLKDRSILDNTDKTAEFTQANEVNRLLSMTDLGRRALALKGKN